LEGRPSADAGTVEDVQPYVVSRDYFHTMGIQVMEGRTFDATDNATAARTAMVNQEFVRRYSDGRPVVGRGFTFGDPEDPGTDWYTIIGTVADVAQEGLDRGGYPQVYRTMDQVPVRSGYAMVRTSGDPLSMVPTVRSAVASAAPDAAVASTRTMTDRMSETVARPRASATLLTGFALVAPIGIYGVMAYTTALRTREVGIRLALGGSPSSVLRLIVKQGMLPVAGRMALGAAGALLAGRVLGRFLFGVGSADPLTFSLT